MLPDVLRQGLRLVICGTAAGKRSAAKKQYYAGRGNQFWKVLYNVGLTGGQILAPADLAVAGIRDWFDRSGKKRCRKRP
jgi:double-stranded uracil-DNA glycosylase